MNEASLKRLITDKEYRMKTLYKIVDKDTNRITFQRNRAQEHFNKHRAKRNIILKSRQLGFTTYEANDMLDDTLFSKNFESLFIAHTQDAALEIFNKKVNFAWTNLDRDLAPLWKVENDASNKLRFNFGDDSYSAITVANSGRSGTYNRVHISEFAKLCATYPKRADEIITGTIPAVPLGGRLDIESTAEGMGGHFADMWWKAWKRGEPRNEKEFKAHFYNWRWDDVELAKIKIISVESMEQSEKFAEYQKLHNLSDKEISYYYANWVSLGEDWSLLRQEFPTTPEEAFILSGSPYFDNDDIFKLLQKTEEPKERVEIELVDNLPIITSKSDGDLKVWKTPSKFSSYVIGGDTAEGIEGGDYSVLTVIDNQSLKTVAKYKAHISPDAFAKVSYALGVWYNNAYLGIEVNKDGLWVNTELYKMGYPNLYYREQLDDIANKTGRQVGFRTDEKTRPYILSELRKMMNNYPNIWTNKDFLNECLTFVRNPKGRPEATSGKNDDEIFATAIAYEIRRNAPEALDEPVEVEDNGNDYVKQRLAMLYPKNEGSVVSQEDYL